MRNTTATQYTPDAGSAGVVQVVSPAYALVYSSKELEFIVISLEKKKSGEDNASEDAISEKVCAARRRPAAAPTV